MADKSTQSHWEDVYSTKGEQDVSWFQQTPETSLELLRLAGATRETGIIDIGGGASNLVDHLLSEEFHDLTVLDISETALEAARSRLGELASLVNWICADITSWKPHRRYDIWHDRAAFHFLLDASEQQRYAEVLKSALQPGGFIILGTFALDGPEKCSGLPVARHNSESLSKVLGPQFELVDARGHEHITPWNSVQKFQFSTFQQTG